MFIKQLCSPLKTCTCVHVYNTQSIVIRFTFAGKYFIYPVFNNFENQLKMIVLENCYPGIRIAGVGDKHIR